jgi:hypothetical protein
VNVKRAVATAVGVLGTLILVVALGAGYLAGHSSSARAGASTPTTAAPVKATLDAIVSADGVRTPTIFGDGNIVSAIFSGGTGVPGTITFPSTTTTGNTITGAPAGGTGATVTPTDGTGGVTAAIFGD